MCKDRSQNIRIKLFMIKTVIKKTGINTKDLLFTVC